MNLFTYLLTYVIAFAITGLLVGALARLALPGKDPLTIPQTIFIGISGSLIAGLIVYTISGTTEAGILLSVIVAMGLLYLARRRHGGTPTDPGLGAQPR